MKIIKYGAVEIHDDQYGSLGNGISITWPSFGEVSISDARKFVADLTNAVKHAKQLEIKN